VLILALIATYRISDVVMGIMANPFYVDMGFSKDEVAAVTKIYGVVMTLVGAFVGGVPWPCAGRDAGVAAGRRAECRHQFAVCLAGGTGPRCERPDLCDVGRQPGQRHRLGGVYCLPVVADQRQLLGHAIRACSAP
jgi:hypothetical protein